MNTNSFRHTSTSDGVVVITHADTDSGFALARTLLAAGRRVVVTAHTPSSLARILLGQSCDQIIAIGADFDDPAQRAGVLQRAGDRLGPIAAVIDGRQDQTADRGLAVAS